MQEKYRRQKRVTRAPLYPLRPEAQSVQTRFRSDALRGYMNVNLEDTLLAGAIRKLRQKAPRRNISWRRYRSSIHVNGPEIRTIQGDKIEAD